MSRTKQTTLGSSDLEKIKAIIKLGPDFLKQANHQSSHCSYPGFKDCVGALDGTHIPARVRLTDQPPFRNRKGFISQNVLVVCGFDLNFQYVLSGWEGSANDARVLQSALSKNGNRVIIPQGKYFLVDAGYGNSPGFLAPYRGVRYHLSEHRGRVPRTEKELFNKLHSSARNVIERAFGILKGRFPVLKLAPQYSYKKQVAIVNACCILHNFIRLHGEDELDNVDINDSNPVDDEDEDDEDEVECNHAYMPSQRERDDWRIFRDQLATSAWNECRARH